MKSRLHAFMVITAIAWSTATAPQAGATPRQQTAPPPTGGQTTAPPQPTPQSSDEYLGPGWITGWSYMSLIGNVFVTDVILSRGHVTAGGDLITWRGPLATATFGTKGFEVGAGYGRATMSLLPFCYELRAVGGQVREQTSGLAPGQWYAGGEAVASFLVFRFTGGVVVPVGNGTVSHKPVPIGSVGVVLTLPFPWKVK